MNATKFYDFSDRIYRINRIGLKSYPVNPVILSNVVVVTVMDWKKKSNPIIMK